MEQHQKPNQPMTIEQQLFTRVSSKVSSLFRKDLEQTKETKLINILTSSHDQGVIRNGGRRGAAYGPSAIIYALSKMGLPHQQDLPLLSQYEIAPKNKNDSSFADDQKTSCENIEKLSIKRPIIHLGGGHDHIYPLIKALNYKKIHLINLDAHLDTRQDSLYHSGTPFRQLAKHYQKRMRLTQIGIQDASNAKNNYNELDCEMVIHSDLDVLNNGAQIVSDIFEQHSQSKGEALILSLDADALNSQYMEAVSAVNYRGLEASFVSNLFYEYYKRIPANEWCLGIYEYNPIFDNLSQKGAKFLAGLIYRGIESFHYNS